MGRSFDWKSVRNWAFWISATALLWSPPVIFWLTGEITISTLVFLGAGGFAFLTKFDSLEELTMGPLTARMRKTIEEATATVEQLRDVATVVARSALTDIMSGCFIQGMKMSTRLELRDDIVKSLEKLEVTPEQVSQVLVDWNKGICRIYARGIGRMVENDIPQEQKAEFVRKCNELSDFREWEAPSPTQLKQLFQSFDYEPLPEAIAALQDYEHFAETGEVRYRLILEQF